MPPRNENGYPWLQWKVDESVVDDKIDQWLKLNYESAWKIPEKVYITTGRHNGKSAALAEYYQNDIELTKSLYKHVKEKEMNYRNIMNQLRKDMYVEVPLPVVEASSSPQPRLSPLTITPSPVRSSTILRLALLSSCGRMVRRPLSVLLRMSRWMCTTHSALLSVSVSTAPIAP